MSYELDMAAIEANRLMEEAAAAYDEAADQGLPREETRPLLDAYLAAKRAAGIASATADYGPTGGELIDLGYRLKAAREEYDTVMQMASQLAVRADAEQSVSIPQTVIAKHLGVDRMTVRKWLGL